MKKQIFWILIFGFVLFITLEGTLASTQFWNTSACSQNAGDYMNSMYYNVDVINTTFLKNYSRAIFNISAGELALYASNAGSGFEVNNTLFSTKGNYTIGFEFYPITANAGQGWFTMNRTGGLNWQPSLFATNSLTDGIGVWFGGGWHTIAPGVFKTGKWYNVSIYIGNITDDRIFVNITIWNSSTAVANYGEGGTPWATLSTWGRGFFFGYAGMDTADSTSDAAKFRNIRVFNGTHCPEITAGDGSANETEGDDAIEVAINSSVPSATKHKTQQVYVVNSSNAQWQGTVDYLVIQNSPQRRWLLNYITSGERYLNAQNLSNTVYVLEITDKTTAEITQEMSTFINATK